MICIVLVFFKVIEVLNAQKSSGSLPIFVKDVGIFDMKKGDAAMIFYVTVTNTGQDPVELSVQMKKCCQEFTRDDKECESMKLIEGHMNELYPQDSRNLTLIYRNLYLHNRIGSCVVEISDTKGAGISRNISFNTKLRIGENVHVPRLLEKYYDPDDAMICDSVDLDPLNTCKPYMCDIRYDGTRSRYNFTRQRCEPIPNCLSPSDEEKVAYDITTNTCRKLILFMKEDDFAEFKDGKPGVRTLTHEHGYPIIAECHNGKLDRKGHFCECEEGWSSAPFDHKYFNPDLQVLHMCTVWRGDMTAEQAKKITVKPKSLFRRFNIIIYSIFGACFLIVIPLSFYLLYRVRRSRKRAETDIKSERKRLLERE